MSFNDNDFIDLLNYCRDINNFHKNAKIPYDNLSNISKSQNNFSFIDNKDFFMFNLDHLCFNANLRNNGKPKRNLPASSDALFFDKEKSILYFFEFKNLPLKSKDYRKVFKCIIDRLNKDYNISKTLNNHLNNTYSRFEDEIICKLKIKTTESLFFSLPLIYENYCENYGLNFNQCKNDFFMWILNSNKKFIFVFADNRDMNISNYHLSFDVKLRDKLRHFENIPNIKTSIVTKNDFEKRFLYKNFDKS